MENNSFRLKSLLNSRVEARISENRIFRGILIGFDKHLNLVLKDCQEIIITDGYPNISDRGLLVIRGVNVITLKEEEVPPIQFQSNSSFIQFGVGKVRPFARGYA